MNNNKSEWNIEKLFKLFPEDEPKWNVPELLELCPTENTNKARIFFTTLQGKIGRIYYAREQIKNQSIPLSSQHFGAFRLESLIYLETIAYNLHSLPDVIAHIIVTIILQPLSEQTQNTSYLPKNDKHTSINSIKTIIEKLKNNPDESWKRRYYENLLKSIDALIDSQEFKYVQAFVNTVKHRNLIYEEFLLKVGRDEKQSWKFDKFEKDGNTFNQIEHQELFNYADNILDNFYKIGEEINNYCRALSLRTQMKQELISLFSGIIAGDGDIGSRMASSHPGAKPPYPPPIDSYVENLYKDLRQGKFNHLTPA